MSVVPASLQGGSLPTDASSRDTPPDDNDDRAIIRALCERLVQYLGQEHPPEPKTSLLYLPEPQNRQHRLVLINPAVLRTNSEIAFMAFFGQKRPGADEQMLEALDLNLIEDFSAHPDILSYSSLQLIDGNWANLVLIRSAAGMAIWSRNKRHAHASRVVAPTCFDTIRLHRGVMPRGIQLQMPFEIKHTQYLDFRS